MLFTAYILPLFPIFLLLWNLRQQTGFFLSCLPSSPRPDSHSLSFSKFLFLACAGLPRFLQPRRNESDAIPRPRLFQLLQTKCQFCAAPQEAAVRVGYSPGAIACCFLNLIGSVAFRGAGNLGPAPRNPLTHQVTHSKRDEGCVFSSGCSQ